MMTNHIFSEEVVSSAITAYEAGRLPSQILRDIAVQHPTATVPDLMMLMEEAFGLPFSKVQCIGGWWHDGTSELSDRQLDAFLVKEIKAGLSERGE